MLYILDGAKKNSRINIETKSNNNNEKNNSWIRMTISFLFLYSFLFRILSYYSWLLLLFWLLS